jgi:hypothetical protein
VRERAVAEPVDSITRGRPASRLAKMLLAGFVPLNAADMARFYPELFHESGSARGSVAAAAQAIHRWGGKAAVLAEVERLARRSPDAFDSVTYQPQGQGFKAREGIFRRRQLHEARDRVRREFPDGLDGWSARSFTPGRARPSLWSADEHAFPGNKVVSRICHCPLRPLARKWAWRVRRWRQIIRERLPMADRRRRPPQKTPQHTQRRWPRAKLLRATKRRGEAGVVSTRPAP